MCGMDLSVNSPAVCVVVEEQGQRTWHVACFACRKNDHKAPLRSIGNACLHVLPRVPDSSHPDMVRYKHIVDQITRFMEDKGVDSSTDIVCENYAYKPNDQAAHSDKLHEVSGILRYTVHEKWPSKVVRRIGIGTWKKLVVGTGNASKLDVVNHVNTLLGTDLMDAFGLKLTKDGSVPCPVQDFADSLCVAASALPDMHKPKKRKLPRQNGATKKKKKTIKTTTV